jgi:hypothetical protein
MAEKKTIHMPYLPELEDIHDPEQVITVLDRDGTRRTIAEQNWAKEFPYAPLTTINAAHTDKAIYIDFFVRSNYLRAVNDKNQLPVSQDSCVEFFVSPTSDNHYWNFEFNCIGAINASHRSERHNPTRLNDEELARIKRYASCGSRPFCEMEGMFAWNVLIRVPLDMLGVEYHGEPIKMTGNFYKCASATSWPHYLSWNPIHTDKPDFHRPEFFGDIVLD